ncbi:MAG TPA: LptF/LptG family permease [Ferruginibacter sp.]|jgi:lipopolysaccharide export system permease protein|nr:LptF/LptG family permease [Ferruginibacter sp.]
MIKKLDKLILKSFIGPFIVTFFISLFVLMLQILWKYVDDLVGKGLDFITIMKFIALASAELLTLAMPIAILISSIMTFGNLGERFELVAIKSSGISLLRFMRPLIWVSFLLCGVTFLFANYVIPYSNYKFKTLYYDIVYKKPALDLKEGTFFTHINGYAIKVGKKDADGKTIHNIIIYEQQNPLQDNSILAEKGIMTTTPDKQFLEFTLQNGVRYQEKGNYYDTSTEFIQMSFKEYKKLIDLSSLQMLNTSDSSFKKDQKSFSIHELNAAKDSFIKVDDSLARKSYKQSFTQMRYNTIADSVWKKVAGIPASKEKKFIHLLPDSAKAGVYSTAYATIANMRNTYRYAVDNITEKKEEIRSVDIEWHRRFSLSAACLVLFFIGAPLGSIIRKGGLGMPLLVAMVFFLLFYLLNVFGEKFVKEGLWPPYFGMWFSVLVLSPVGAFLTYKAMHDSQLFNKEFYTRMFRKVKFAYTGLINKKTV